MTTPLPGMPKPPKGCKDCPPGVKRPAPHPGPRCATHHREAKKEQKQRAHTAAVNKTYSFADADHYDRLYKLQGGKCAICQRATGKTKRLAVDHDHKTDEVRGLLCSTCNRILGHFRDDPNAFGRAIVYLNDPPYRTLLKEYARELLNEVPLP